MRASWMYVICLIAIFMLAGCGESVQTNENNQENIEGIEVELTIKSNSQLTDEGIFEAIITNTNDLTFTGSVSFYNTQFKYWKLDIENLPPGQSFVSELKTDYIEHPEDGYRYTVEGNLEDKSFASSAEYEVVNNEGEQSFLIKTEEASKETSVEIVSELYSIYGEKMLHVEIYENGQSLTDDMPKAVYFANKVSKTITIYNEDGESEQLEFIP